MKRTNQTQQVSNRAISLLGLAFVLLSYASAAQSLQVQKVEIAADNLIVYYSLTDTVPQRNYSINLYSSRDNFLNPLVHVTGDLGLEVKPGIQKKIVWNAKQELGSAFNGRVAVELRARVYIPFITFDSFDKIKRGKPKEVTWRGGTKQNILNFELYDKTNKRVDVLPNITNAGHTKLFIPMDVKPGKGYTFRIVDSKNKDQAVITRPFVIRRKVPLLYYALATAAIGFGIQQFLDKKPESQDIANPLGPPKIE